MAEHLRVSEKPAAVEQTESIQEKGFLSGVGNFFKKKAQQISDIARMDVKDVAKKLLGREPEKADVPAPLTQKGTIIAAKDLPVLPTPVVDAPVIANIQEATEIAPPTPSEKEEEVQHDNIVYLHSSLSQKGKSQLKEAKDDSIVDLKNFAKTKTQQKAVDEKELTAVRYNIRLLEMMVQDEKIKITELSKKFADFLGVDEADLLGGASNTEFVEELMADHALTTEDPAKVVQFKDKYFAKHGAELTETHVAEESHEVEYSMHDRWRIMWALVNLSTSGFEINPVLKAELQTMLNRHLQQKKARPLAEMPDLPA